MHPGDSEVYSADDELSLSPVNRWRFNVFVDAGFDHLDAHKLAVSNADVHQLLESLENGCSLELALDIFL
jgi:hypothetical protein